MKTAVGADEQNYANNVLGVSIHNRLLDIILKVINRICEILQMTGYIHNKCRSLYLTFTQDFKSVHD